MQRARVGTTAAVAVLVVAALGLGVLAWRTRQLLTSRPAEILATLSSTLGLPVEADGVRVTWWPPGLVLQGIRIPDRSPLGPGNLAHADEARLTVSMGSLLTGDVVVTSIEITTPVVRLVRGVDGDWNFASPMTQETGAGGAPAERAGGGAGPRLRPPQFDVADVAITRGRVSLRDRAVPGVPEFEITSTEARLFRYGGGSRLEFEGRALGGPAPNLRGTIDLPARAGELELRLTADAISARRLHEVLQLARGRIPFDASLDGVVSVKVSGRAPPRWPPGEADLAVVLDATEATAKVANGYVRKPAGAPLTIALDLLAGPDLLQIRRAALESGEARVEVESSASRDAASDRQPALRLTSSNLSATLLAEWVPIVSALGPVGDLSLQGTIAPGDEEAAVQLRLSGSDLGVRVGREPARLGAAAIDLDSRPGGRFTAGISFEDLRSDDVHAQRLSAAVEGGEGSPIKLRIEGARGGRAGAEIDRLALECSIDGERTDVTRLEVAGLGGTLRAQGDVQRGPADVLQIRMAPRWDGLDFSGLLRLVGVDVDVEGSFTGRAALAARQGGSESLLETLTGVFDVRLERGELPGVNVARATVGNLGTIPGLRQAVERRARDEMPALLARTSRIDSLVADGSIVDGVVAVSKLRLDAADYALDADGRIAFDGTVDLDGSLLLGEEATRTLVSASGLLAMLAPDGESIRIPVSIEGTYPDLVSAPSPAFLSDSVGGGAARDRSRGAGDLLRRFLGVDSGSEASGDGEDAE